MTKADIISKIVETTGLPKKDVAATVEAFMSEIRTCMADNKENVYLRGFAKRKKEEGPQDGYSQA